MNRADLFEQIKRKQSYLCVGLDPDLDRIPPHLLSEPDPVLTFNKAIIDATRDLCVAYKPNMAFFEALGPQGWHTLAETIAYIGNEHLIIADAKRGDIGNTSKRYAQAFFEKLGADALTIAPYMGEDSVKPFLGFEGKWVVLLALTSNSGSADFQFTTDVESGLPLFERVLKKAQIWAGPDELMFVVGATHPEQFAYIRQKAPDYFFLVPGVGAQGGDLEAISRNGFNRYCGLLVNSSRGILYAGNDHQFAIAARREALQLQSSMAELLKELPASE